MSAWTEKRIAYDLATTLFPWRRWIVVENVSWGLLPHEADVVALSRAGWLSEIEIKISVSDFRRDAKKAKHRLHFGQPELVHKFYYAMPATVLERVRAEIPAGAGIISMHHSDVRSQTAVKEREAAAISNSRQLTDGERWRLMRLAYIRYWARLAPPPIPVEAVAA